MNNRPKVGCRHHWECKECQKVRHELKRAKDTLEMLRPFIAPTTDPKDYRLLKDALWSIRTYAKNRAKEIANERKR